MNNKLITLTTLVLLCGPGQPITAQPAQKTSAPIVVQIDSAATAPYYPVMVAGRLLDKLQGIPVRRIGVFSHTGRGAEPIPFQVDRRADNGQYLLGHDVDDDNPDRVFTAHDELVFMAGDAGDTSNDTPAQAAGAIVIELDIGGGHDRKRAYITISEGDAPRSLIDHVRYDATTDSIETDTYRLTFFREHPFLVEKLQWRTSNKDGYGANIADRMKVRHRGKLFGRYNFLRTESDYHSRLVAYKDGPVRVIRKTRNQVRVLWYLRSPSVDMDYIVYANQVVMDTTLDFPFKLGWFFKDVTTFASMDLTGLQPTRLYQLDMHNWLDLDGTMSAQKQQYNDAEFQDFMLTNSDGLILGNMQLSDGLPITWRTHLIDDITQPDPPEKIPGQFGNIGFLTENWDKVGTGVHHLYYKFYLIPGVQIENVINTLKTEHDKHTS